MVPPGSRRIRSQREALRAGLACPDLAGVRRDFRDHLTGWWRIHVSYASWGGAGHPPRGTTEPTRALVCSPPEHDERGRRRGGIDISQSTYKRCRRWWQARGYVAIVRPGWTPVLRAMALVGPEDHNERQVLVLCLPRKKPSPPARGSVQALTGPLSSSRREPDKAPRGREAKPEGKPGKARAPRGQPVLPPPGPAPLAAVPQNRSEALTAAQAMQERIVLLRRLSAEHLRHLARPFWAAGWLPRDVLRAIDYEPSGRQHGYSAGVRSPAGWVRARLAAWLGPDGAPLPSHRQQLAAAAGRHRAYLARQRAADPAAAARADQLREAHAAGRAAAEGESIGAEDQAAAAELLARIRASRRGRPGDARRAEAAPARAKAGPDDERWQAAVAAAVRAVAEQEAAAHANGCRAQQEPVT